MHRKQYKRWLENLPENDPLREELISKGYVFESETDTEVIVHLIVLSRSYIIPKNWLLGRTTMGVHREIYA